MVADDGGSEPLEPVIRAFESRMQVTLVRQEAAGPAAARNRGARIARGRYLAFTDDDCAPAPDWLAAIAARLQGYAGGVIGGRAINALRDNFYSAASQALLGYLYDYYNSDNGSARFLASCNLVVPANLYRSLGGFAAEYPAAAAEDRDLCDRALAAGVRMSYAPEAVVHHMHALSWRSFWKQHFGYGRGAFRFHRGRNARTDERIRVEPLRFYGRMLSYPFRSGEARPLTLALLLVVAQAANVLGFCREAFSRRGAPAGDAAASGE